jgi:AAA+ ATPase superfamily predicted ATPase
MQYVAYGFCIYVVSKVYDIFKDNKLNDALTEIVYRKPKYIYDNVVYYVESIQDIHKISTRMHPNRRIVACMKTGKLVGEYMYRDFINYTNTSIMHVDNTKFQLTYKYEGVEYKVTINRRADPELSLNIINIRNQDDIDVTDDVLKHYGPARDLHHQSITPKCMGYKYLMIEYLCPQDYVEKCIVIHENDELPSGKSIKHQTNMSLIRDS